MAKTSKPMDVQKHMRTARLREVEYGEIEAPRPKFIKWLRGKFGATVAERHGEKVAEGKVGKPYTRVQHRVGQGQR